MTKTYHFVTSLQFEAESEDEAFQQLQCYLIDSIGDSDNALHGIEHWALDPADEDDDSHECDDCHEKITNDEWEQGQGLCRSCIKAIQ